LLRRDTALKWLAGGLVFWLLDSLLLMLSQQMAFGAAFLSEVSPGRLLLRLVVLAILFFPLLNSFLKRIGSEKHLQTQNWPYGHAADLWYGAPASPQKSKRLLFYALRLAAALRLNAHEQDKLRRLCYCYDLGVFAIDADRSNTVEWERHIQLGAKIAAQFRMLEVIVPLILAHEEYYNGSGYYCLSGKRIPVQCRILQVVLMFDQVTGGKRPKRKAQLVEALDELTFYAGTVLDPELVRLFQNLMLRPRLEQEEREELLNMS
jgi:hypothetical protein